MNRQSIFYNIKNGSLIRAIDIMDEDADLEVAADDKGNSLYHKAFRNEEPNQARIIKVFDILLNRGFDINVKNYDGNTVLHLSIERRYKDVIDFFIQRNVHLSFTNSSGSTLGHLAIEEECRKYHRLMSRNGNIAALENESSSFLEWMLSRGIDFFYKRNKYNQSAFYLAIELNLQSILLILLEYVTDFPSIEKDQEPLLCYFLKMHYSARGIANYHDYKSLQPIHTKYYLDRHFYEIVKIILEKSQSMSNEILNEALHLAIDYEESIDLLNLILHNVPSIQQFQTNGESLIQYLTKQFYTQKYNRGIEHVMKVLKALVDKGADINEPYENGLTIALNWFLYYPKLKMLQVLQYCGTDFHTRTKDYERFLHLVSRHGNEFGMVKIAKEGCDINTLNSKGETPLKIAITYGKICIALDLLDFGADVNDMRDGKSLLCLACIHGRTKVVEKLIKLGADFEYEDKEGKTLLHLAVNHQSTVELLIKHGADVDAKDNLGRTPLHYANHCDVIATLIRYGAFVESLDYVGHTPLYYAINGSWMIIAELLKHGADILEPKVFQRVLGLFQHPFAMRHDSSRYIMEHLTKMSAVDLMFKISHIYHSSEPDLKMFFSKCQAEVKSLKDFFVNDFTSLYKLLHKNLNLRYAYAGNEKLIALVEDPAIVQQFPKYFDLIIGCYNQARSRKLLLIEATCSLDKLIEVSLPDICTYEIFIYLSNVDLVNLIEAGEIL